MANGSYGKCAGCGAMVIWVKTQAGKNMPCDPTLHNYKIDPTGKEKIVTQTGKVVTGVTGVDAQSADVDTISGATFSSTGIREAVIQALEKAE